MSNNKPIVNENISKGEIIRTYCNNCGQNINHQILMDYCESGEEVFDSDPGIPGFTKGFVDAADFKFDYQIVKCIGCDTVSYRSDNFFAIYQDHDNDGRWEERFPMPVSVEEKGHVEYVNLSRIQELINTVSPDYDLKKLIQFCKELNSAYKNKLYLSVPLLVRAIIDHIPPIFGQANFSDVYSNHGGKSFKESMKNLDKSLRKIADANMHTQIRKKEVLPNETQINFKPDLDILLSEICRYLGK